MQNKNNALAGLFIAISIICLGFFINAGIDNFVNKDRKVSVKGLAELEVKANQVVWPILYIEAGNDLRSIYATITRKNKDILNFLKENGLSDKEISLGAPNIIDKKANSYENNRNIDFRYSVTSVITVSSEKVDLILKLMLKQTELLTKGIAIGGDNYSYPIRFTFTKLNDVKPKMIEEATKNARKAALKFAEDSKSNLGKIRYASQGQFSIYDRDPNTPYIKKIRVVTSVAYGLVD
ncbi:MAG: SIMPL domain-containing protein [Massilibacteroides sp.]|nr:SIMPL domain-containing protein [Massilibacteroides sp.]